MPKYQRIFDFDEYESQFKRDANRDFAIEAKKNKRPVIYLDGVNLATTRALQDVGIRSTRLHMIEHDYDVAEYVRNNSSINIHNCCTSEFIPDRIFGSIYLDLKGYKLKYVKSILTRLYANGSMVDNFTLFLTLAGTRQGRTPQHFIGTKEMMTVYVDMITCEFGLNIYYNESYNKNINSSKMYLIKANNKS